MLSKDHSEMKGEILSNAHFLVDGFFRHGMLRRAPRKARENATLREAAEGEKRGRRGKAHEDPR